LNANDTGIEEWGFPTPRAVVEAEIIAIDGSAPIIAWLP
jgi:hypothetical protein